MIDATATAESLVDRLSQHRTLGAAPRAELEWLVAHGRSRRLAPGELLSTNGRPIEGLHIILSGLASFHIHRAAVRKKVTEWRAGDVTGVLPYSRLVFAPGDTIVDEPLEAITVDREFLPALIEACPQATAMLVHVMLDRARIFNASDLHDEKMVSLGKLSSGLAHELNNPASAAARSARLLTNGLQEADQAARALGALRLDPAQLDAVARVRELCLTAPITVTRSPVEQSDREEQMAEWLTRHEADTSGAAALADTAVSTDILEELSRVMRGESLSTALRWIVAACNMKSLATDIERASTRVYELVSAVKGFTYMDRASVPEPVDVAHGLRDTLSILAAEARGKSVTVTIDVPADLPAAYGVGGELNQVWANLIENAIDAVPAGGHVTVSARATIAGVQVSVIDDGPGIPDDIRNRIFDPFFTTKPVGEGTGLGLDIVRRVVFQNSGEITVESRPGRTEFCVSLPLVPTRTQQMRAAPPQAGASS